jgi:hypothetical protein
MTALTITYDETNRGIALWVHTRADVPTRPILFDADQAHVLLHELGRAINTGETALRTVNGDQWPRVEVGWDQTVGKVAIWLQPRPDGPRGPILLPAVKACEVIAALHQAIDDRDRMRGDIDAIREADPDDFRGN